MVGTLWKVPWSCSQLGSSRALSAAAPGCSPRVQLPSLPAPGAPGLCSRTLRAGRRLPRHPGGCGWHGGAGSAGGGCLCVQRCWHSSSCRTASPPGPPVTGPGLRGRRLHAGHRPGQRHSPGQSHLCSTAAGLGPPAPARISLVTVPGHCRVSGTAALQATLWTKEMWGQRCCPCQRGLRMRAGGAGHLHRQVGASCHVPAVMSQLSPPS